LFSCILGSPYVHSLFEEDVHEGPDWVTRGE
jgi:hypothetical protein